VFRFAGNRYKEDPQGLEELKHRDPPGSYNAKRARELLQALALFWR
jgi:hypothetical protein